MRSSSKTPASEAHAPPSSHAILADLCAHGQDFVAAAGGGGGRGNRTFASGGNRSPRKAEPGSAGGSAKCVRAVARVVAFHAVCMYELELRLIADVGLVRCSIKSAATELNVVRRSVGQTQGKALYSQPSAMPSRKLHLFHSQRCLRISALFSAPLLAAICAFIFL